MKYIRLIKAKNINLVEDAKKAARTFVDEKVYSILERKKVGDLEFVKNHPPRIDTRNKDNLWISVYLDSFGHTLYICIYYFELILEITYSGAGRDNFYDKFNYSLRNQDYDYILEYYFNKAIDKIAELKQENPEEYTINYAKKYGQDIVDDIVYNLQDLHKKIYPSANIFWGQAEGQWDKEDNKFICKFSFSLPIKYRKQVNEIIKRCQNEYPKVNIKADIFLNTEENEYQKSWSYIEIYNK